jgi:hypothetical protein
MSIFFAPNGRAGALKFFAGFGGSFEGIIKNLGGAGIEDICFGTLTAFGDGGLSIF